MPGKSFFYGDGIQNFSKNFVKEGYFYEWEGKWWVNLSLPLKHEEQWGALNIGR